MTEVMDKTWSLYEAEKAAGNAESADMIGDAYTVLAGRAKQSRERVNNSSRSGRKTTPTTTPTPTTPGLQNKFHW